MKLRIFAPIVALLLASVMLAACGGAGQDNFTGRTPRSADEMGGYIAAAHELADQRKAAVEEDAEEGELSEKANDPFLRGVTAYEEARYDDAVNWFEGALNSYPLHFGSNVDLSLAYLQNEKPNEAFKQALACVMLFPSEGGALLNAQVTGVGCGFSAEAVVDGLEQIYSEADSGVSLSSTLSSGDVADYYEYNRVWDTIDVGLAEGEENTENDAAFTFEELNTRLGMLESAHSDDSDIAALHAFLNAVGEQKGFVAFEG